jgi:hypothetical protein
MNTPPRSAAARVAAPQGGWASLGAARRQAPTHPRRAARDPLKGAALAVRQSRPGGALGWAASLFDAVVFLLSVYFIRLPKGVAALGDFP